MDQMKLEQIIFKNGILYRLAERDVIIRTLP